MKLFFPNGEHAQFLLADGATRIGSGGDCDIVLSVPGVVAAHASLTLSAGVLTVAAASSNAAVSVNGKPVTATAVEARGGDLLGFASVQCRVLASEQTRESAQEAPAKSKPAGDDDGRTRVRGALPKFILRGVSGATFGKTFPVVGEMVIGRHSECEISVPTEEISRRHAKIRATPDGVKVEDLGSANGTFINDKRVREAVMEPGDELRLDAVRFMLISPGMEAKAVARKSTVSPAAASTGSPPWLWVGIGGALVALAAVLFLVLR